MSRTTAAWYQACKADPESDIAFHFDRMADLMAEYGVVNIIELGVRDGHSTACWLHNRRSGGQLWSVDIEQTRLVWQRGWTFVCGDDLDPAVMAQLPAVVDLLFIDTSHAYDHTVAELAAYGPRVRPGGLIVLHDTANEHPEDHGEPIGPQEPFPVLRAMVEYAEAHGFKWDNDERSWGLGVIYC